MAHSSSLNIPLQSARHLLWVTLLALALVACDGERNSAPGTSPIDADAGADTFSEVGDDVDDRDVDSGETGVDASQPETGPLPDTTVPQPDAPPDEPINLDDLRVPNRIDTILERDTVAAGDIIGVRCALYDVRGNELPIPAGATINTFMAPVASVRNTGAGLMAIVAGGVDLWCAAPSLALTDLEPAELTIVPGPPHSVMTEVSPHVVTAGNSVDVRCTAADAFGNVIRNADYDITVDASDAVVTGTEVLITTTGEYVVTCRAKVISEEFFPDVFEVRPDLPASIAVSLFPARPLYGLTEVVSLRWTVSDRYGNPIPDAPVQVGSDSELPVFGFGRFRLTEEGTHTLWVSVDPPTFEDLPVFGSVDVEVHGDGPTIVCDEPEDGAILNRPSTGTMTVSGTVADASGVTSVMVAGQPATLVDGRFTADVPVRYGINFVEVRAVDGFGEENARTCTTLIAEDWIPANSFFDNGVTLRMLQSAIDDGNRAGPANSFGDLLHLALNSSAIRDTLHEGLVGANPLVNECITRVFGSCILRVRVNYRDARIRGPNDVSLTLVEGGLRARATIRNPGLNIHISSLVSTGGWVNLAYITIDMTMMLGVDASGNPSITSVTIADPDVGRITTEFSGLAGAIINIIASLAEGLLRDVMRDQLRSFVRDGFGDILEGVIGGLDISSLGSSFAVPRLDGSGEIDLGFGVRFSSLSMTPARALFGMGTRFTGPAMRPAGPGAPRPPGSVFAEPSVPGNIMAAVNLGLMNQAMYTLWRAGLFDVRMAGEALGELPGELNLDLSVGLPPVITSAGDGRIQFMLGAMVAVLDLELPGLEGIPLEIGMVASASVHIEGDDDIIFGDVQIEELYFQSPFVSLAGDTRELIQGFLIRVMESLVEDALNSALPALPVPSFPIPDDLVAFGIPPGELGLRSPGLLTTLTHFVAYGNFGAR